MHKFKKTLLATSLMALSSVAAAEFSANVALTSNYMWRGFSQTQTATSGDFSPAIQGGFDYAAKSGFYAGTWGSNVDFGGVENMEWDIYGGYATEVGGLGVDVGAIKYLYFDNANNVDFAEAYIGVSYGMFSAQANFQIEGADIGDYFEAGVEVPVGGVTLAAHVGKYNYDTGLDPVDYSVGVSGEAAGFGWDLTWTDTNGDGETRYGKAGGGSHIVFTISKSI